MTRSRGPASIVSLVVTRARWARMAAGRPWAGAQAIMDAVRAWAIASAWSSSPLFGGASDNGVTRLRSGQAVRRGEQLRVRLQTARWVFLHSARLGIADSIVIPHFRTEGLLANFLHVLETVHRARPGASVYVDWVLRGDELGFRYGRVGDDIWSDLFRPLGPYPPGAPHRASLPIDFAFWRTGKDYLAGWRLRRHRRSYHATISKWIEVSNPRVLEQVRGISEQSLDGRFCIGVHRRVPNARVALLQADGQVPSLDRFIATAESIIAKKRAPEWTIFLATDDAEAVDAFRRVFGSRLAVRDHVQRTTARSEEVHFRGWNRISLADAEDVLIDTILLSRCDVLIHASSSVSTVAALMNPDLTLVRPKVTN